MSKLDRFQPEPWPLMHHEPPESYGDDDPRHPCNLTGEDERCIEADEPDANPDREYHDQRGDN